MGWRATVSHIIVTANWMGCGAKCRSDPLVSLSAAGAIVELVRHISTSYHKYGFGKPGKVVRLRQVRVDGNNPQG